MKKNSVLPMNLQFFADPNGSGDAGSAQPADSASSTASSAAADSGTTTANEADTAKYTDADVDAIISKKFAKWTAAQEAKQTEAQKLEQMDDDQKKSYELDKAKSEAAGLKDQLARYDMEKTARSLFEAEGVAVTADDVDLVVTSEAESTKANVDRLIDFSKRIRAAAEKEFLQGNPVYRNGSSLNQSAGSRGEEIAKNFASKTKRQNPYFKQPKGE